MDYKRTRLRPTIVIDKLITLYYFEFGKNYVFPGERHDFWELLYVDKGEVEVWADEKRHTLRSGMIIFHKPNEFHRFYANNGKAPNLIVITFDCRSKAMKRFEDAIIYLEDEERNLLAEIIKEGQSAFSFPFRHPLKRRKNAAVGSEQLIKLYLETFLIKLMRKADFSETGRPLSSTVKEKHDDEIVKRTIQLLIERMGEDVSLTEICSALHLSKTRLKDLFKRKTGFTVMEYLAQLKIDKAKELIRESNLSFTEISEKLNFSSVHYFSRAFKRATDMTPSEYARSVKARMQP